MIGKKESKGWLAIHDLTSPQFVTCLVAPDAVLFDKQCVLLNRFAVFLPPKLVAILFGLIGEIGVRRSYRFCICSYLIHDHSFLNHQRLS